MQIYIKLSLLLMGFGYLIFFPGCAGKQINQAGQAGKLVLPAKWDTPQSGGKIFKKDLLELVQSQILRPLIHMSMDNNPNLQVMAVSLKEAGLITRKRAGSRHPEVSATLGSNLSRTGSSSEENYNFSIGVSWEADVWGKLADSRAVAQKREEATREDYQAARNSLCGKLIKEWFNYITVEKMICVETNRLSNFEDNQEVIKQRYLMGLGNLQDLEAAKTTALSTAGRLEKRRFALKQSRRMIQTYLGNIEPRNLSIPRTLPLVETPLAGIPGETLGLRPDLKSAFARIQAADLNTQVAYKSMLPSFTLTPSVALSGTSPSNMLQATPVWNLLVQMTAPLFNGGKLKANMELAGLKAEKAYWIYKKTLIAAMVEVENRLAAEKSLMIQQGKLVRALAHAVQNRKTYQERYRQGLTDILNLLTAQQTAFSLEIELLEVKRNLLCNRIDLGLALGLGV